jgi:hypothetical protein
MGGAARAALVAVARSAPWRGRPAVCGGGSSGMPAGWAGMSLESPRHPFAAPARPDKRLRRAPPPCSGSAGGALRAALR